MHRVSCSKCTPMRNYLKLELFQGLGIIYLVVKECFGRQRQESYFKIIWYRSVCLLSILSQVTYAEIVKCCMTRSRFVDEREVEYVHQVSLLFICIFFKSSFSSNINLLPACVEIYCYMCLFAIDFSLTCTSMF